MSVLENCAVYAASCPGPGDPYYPMAAVHVLSEKSLRYTDEPILLDLAQLSRDLCVSGRVWGLMEVRYLCIWAKALHCCWHQFRVW